MKQDNRQTQLILCLFGILPVVWLGLLIAPAVSGGLPEIITAFPAAMNDPFHIVLCEDSLKTVLIALCAYGMGIGIYFSSRRNYRRGEEHGSAKWGDARAVNKKYRDKSQSQNKLFTQNVRMGLDGRKHRRNLNTVVIGGSGAGKSFNLAKPNLMQANTSFVVLDPKGELVRDTGYLLEQKGYEVRVLDLLNMEKSFCYNPFVYLRDDNDVQRLVTNLFKSTTPKGSQSQDPFWDTSASMLLLALIFYLKYEAPEDEQNFPMVMEMLRAGEIREDDDCYQSPLDELFERLEMKNPDHIAVKYYKDYHSGSAKTLKSIQITLAARLEKFNLAAVKGLVAAIAAGGWVAVVVIIVLCLVGLIAGSVFGIFFSGEDSGTGMSMQTVVQEINQEYDDRLEQEKNSVSYDVLEMSGSRAVWKEVLAVYSVKVNTDPDNPMEVATVDETKKQLLSDIFWEMNDISSQTETKTHTEIEESDDGHGNIVQTETTVTETFLYITVTHKTVDEMAAMYGFNQEQKDYLAELLKDENNQLWSQVLYGIGYSDDQIVTVALSQVGNVGGQPYWSWYGFDSRVEWCACFVSWCANECGYIDAGIIPK